MKQSKKTSAKFFSLLLVEHMADKLPYMTPEQKESLQYSALNNMSRNVYVKEEDEEFFKKIENTDKFINSIPDINQELPWDFISLNPGKEFLKNEYMRLVAFKH